MLEDAFQWACPLCGKPLERQEVDLFVCPADGTTYPCRDGIWRFLTPQKAAYYAPFLENYEVIRRAEGWGSDQSSYFRALPFKDLTGSYPEIWRLRTRSYKTLLKYVIEPLVRRQGPGLRILDIGTGNGWLSYRLAQQQHTLAAVDIRTDCQDGLGAHVYYPPEARFLPVQATFEQLPFCDNQVDLVLIIGSIHYTISYEEALSEALRVLQPEGTMVIMDSPVYSNTSSGLQMVEERQANFRERHGIPGDALPHENFLTLERMAELAANFGMRWRVVKPFYGLRWFIRPWLARLRGRREPADFYLFIAEASR